MRKRTHTFYISYVKSVYRTFEAQCAEEETYLFYLDRCGG
jgi:hypothetical protein